MVAGAAWARARRRAAPLGEWAARDVSRDEWRRDHQDAASASPSVARRTIVSVIGLTLFAHVFLLLRLNVNWDEFFFLSFVYDYARGTLDAPAIRIPAGRTSEAPAA